MTGYNPLCSSCNSSTLIRIYNYIVMLVIQGIQLQNSPLLHERPPKKVRVGYDKYICTNKTAARVSHQQAIIEWREDMQLPIIFGRELEFQFFLRHQFGFHPEEFEAICSAKLTIINYRKGDCQGEVRDSKDNIVGTVYIQFQVATPPSSSSQGTVSPSLPLTLSSSPSWTPAYPLTLTSPTIVIISNMLAHFHKSPSSTSTLSPSASSGFFEVRLNNQSSATPSMELTAGELTWSKKFRLEVFGEIVEGDEVWVGVWVDGQAGTEGLRLEGLIRVGDVWGGGAKFRKVQLVDSKTKKKSGMLFIDIQIPNPRGQLSRTSRTQSNINLPSVIPFRKNTKLKVIAEEPSIIQQQYTGSRAISSVRERERGNVRVVESILIEDRERNSNSMGTRRNPQKNQNTTPAKKSSIATQPSHNKSKAPFNNSPKIVLNSPSPKKPSNPSNPSKSSNSPNPSHPSSNFRQNNKAKQKSNMLMYHYAKDKDKSNSIEEDNRLAELLNAKLNGKSQ